MKTVVLDDDPTGTQSATNVTVLLEYNADVITDTLRDADSVYVQTNSRAISEADARNLVAGVRSAALEAGRRLGEEIQFVLRGDSTLRGHVFSETEQFLEPGSVILFVPAFPDGGRTTAGGIHYVRIEGTDVPAHQSEYADDPVFGFRSAVLTEFVEEKSHREAVPVGLDQVRDGESLTQALLSAPAGAVVVPDAVTNDDIGRIADAVRTARSGGASVVVRSAAPLAAALAGVGSDGLLDGPLLAQPRATLLVCGSHTDGASRQLAAIADRGNAVTINTLEALIDPAGAGSHAAAALREQLAGTGLALVASERSRRGEHNTLDHGERVMSALTAAVADLRTEVEVVIAKGGITSAEVARTGLGATRATVLGQILPGVSVWSVPVAPNRAILYVVIPGNVGGPQTIATVLDAVGLAPAPATAT